MKLPKDPDMLYISRNGNSGWRVRLSRQDNKLHQSYNDFEYGGNNLALQAAKRFRNALVQIMS